MIEKRNLVIIGAGGFGREVLQLIKAINDKNQECFNVLGFIDDGVDQGSQLLGLPVLGGIDFLKNMDPKPAVALAIGDPVSKKTIVEQLQGFEFPELIHPSVALNKDELSIGRGALICEGCILTCDIIVGEFVTLNLSCTVGHDTIIKSYCSIMPGNNISGEVLLLEGVYLGTGATIINQTEIGEFSVIGAGAVVSKNIPANCTAVGIPAKPIKFHKQ